MILVDPCDKKQKCESKQVLSKLKTKLLQTKPFLCLNERNPKPNSMPKGSKSIRENVGIFPKVGDPSCSHQVPDNNYYENVNIRENLDLKTQDSISWGKRGRQFMESESERGAFIFSSHMQGKSTSWFPR